MNILKTLFDIVTLHVDDEPIPLTRPITQKWHCVINIRGYPIKAECWKINQDGYVYAVRVQSHRFPEALKAELGLTAMIPQTTSYIKQSDVGTKLIVVEPV